MLSQFFPVFSEFLLLLECPLLVFFPLLFFAKLVFTCELFYSRVFRLDVGKEVPKFIVELGSLFHAFFPIVLLYQSLDTPVRSVIRVILVDVCELLHCAESRPLLVELHDFLTTRVDITEQCGRSVLLANA